MDSYLISLSKDESGNLSFTSTRGGKLVDISGEPRSAAIKLNSMIKSSMTPIIKSLYVLKHKSIIKLARLEKNDIDALYIKQGKQHAIIVDDKCSVENNFK